MIFLFVSLLVALYENDKWDGRNDLVQVRKKTLKRDKKCFIFSPLYM